VHLLTIYIKMDTRSLHCSLRAVLCKLYQHIWR